MDDEWIRPGEAARLLGVSLTTVARYVDQGLLEARRLPSGQRRVKRASVDALARKGTEDDGLKSADA